MTQIVVADLMAYGIIVTVFNLMWLLQDGWKDYKQLYRGGLSKWLSFFIWVYAISGIISLTLAITHL